MPGDEVFLLEEPLDVKSALFRMFGGRIHLDPSIKLPAWIRDDEMKGFLGYQDLGDEPFRMDGTRRYPYGGNMAFHRRVVERYASIVREEGA